MNSETPFKKPLREKLMNLCGMYWWPPTHNDPRVKGPPPRLISREQEGPSAHIMIYYWRRLTALCVRLLSKA